MLLPAVPGVLSIIIFLFLVLYFFFVAILVVVVVVVVVPSGRMITSPCVAVCHLVP